MINDQQNLMSIALKDCIECLTKEIIHLVRGFKNVLRKEQLGCGKDTVLQSVKQSK